MTLKELKKNRKAYSSLIDLWSELSRISRDSARRDLIEDFGLRYRIDMEGESMVFHDTHAGDSFTYDKERKEWV